jgi:hypothetical protein
MTADDVHGRRAYEEGLRLDAEPGDAVAESSFRT